LLKPKILSPFIEKAGGELSIKWSKSKHLKSNSCFCGFSEILLEIDFETNYLIKKLVVNPNEILMKVSNF
jgi:hypothetical protein